MVRETDQDAVDVHCHLDVDGGLDVKAGLQRVIMAWVSNMADRRNHDAARVLHERKRQAVRHRPDDHVQYTRPACIQTWSMVFGDGTTNSTFLAPAAFERQVIVYHANEKVVRVAYVDLDVQLYHLLELALLDGQERHKRAQPVLRNASFIQFVRVLKFQTRL